MRKTIGLILIVLAIGGAAHAGKKKWKHRKAAELTKSCDAGDKEACTLLGEYKNYGLFGAATSPEQAEALFKTACDAGVMRACGQLGATLQYHADHAGAIVVMEKACDGGDGYACWKRLDSNDKGNGEYLDYADKQKFIEKSFTGYKAACAAGDQIQCTEYAVGIMSAGDLGYGEWFPGDMGDAAKLLDKACKAGWPEACRQQGGAYEGGYGVPQSDKKAKGLYDKACKMGSQDGCDNSKTLVEERASRGIRI